MPTARTLPLLAALAALACAQSAQAAQAATPACLSESEMTGVVAYALPLVVDAAVRTCSPRLAPDGFLVTQGASLVERYATRKAANWPVAKAALFKLTSEKGNKSGGAALLRMLPDSALQSVADGIVTQALGDAIKPDDCAPIDRITGLLAPLPPENTVALVTTIIALSDKRKPDGTPSAGGEDRLGKGGLHLCTAAPANSKG